jgi:TRAP-type C4-dicarboxylate transport system substrate-binding protein
VPKQTFKVGGTWSNLTNWQQNEQPFWTKTLPEASKGQITVNLQSLSELGLKGTEIVRLVKLGLFDFAHGLPIYIAEDATVEGIDIAGVAKTFDMARKTVDAYAPVLGGAFEKKYGARVLNYYTWPSQMFYCNSPIKGLADIKSKKVRVRGTSQDRSRRRVPRALKFLSAMSFPPCSAALSTAASPAPCPPSRPAGTR